MISFGIVKIQKVHKFTIPNPHTSIIYVSSNDPLRSLINKPLSSTRAHSTEYPSVLGRQNVLLSFGCQHVTRELGSRFNKYGI